jgi:hypothetical protein
MHRPMVGPTAFTKPPRIREIYQPTRVYHLVKTTHASGGHTQTESPRTLPQNSHSRVLYRNIHSPRSRSRHICRDGGGRRALGTERARLPRHTVIRAGINPATRVHLQQTHGNPQATLQR